MFARLWLVGGGRLKDVLMNTQAGRLVHVFLFMKEGRLGWLFVPVGSRLETLLICGHASTKPFTLSRSGSRHYFHLPPAQVLTFFTTKDRIIKKKKNYVIFSYPCIQGVYL